MLIKNKIFFDSEQIKNVSQPRKLYRKPHLEELGDLRTLTLGGSIGIGDTGSTGGFEALLGFGSFDGPLLPPEY